MNLRPLVLLAAGLALAVLAFQGSHAVGQGPAPSEIIISHTSDDWADLAPCGCSSGQKGGIARRAAFIDSTRALNPHLLLVDTGNLFDVTEEYQVPRAMFLMRTMKKLGYHTVGVAGKDLGWGIGFYKDSVESAGLLPVSANLADRQTGNLLFKPWNIENVAGVRVGIFSVSAYSNEFEPSRHITGTDTAVAVLDPAAAARRAIGELRPQCDVLVGILNMGNHAADTLAGKLPGLDVALVGATDPMMLRTGQRAGTAMLVSDGVRGQYMSRIRVSLSGLKVSAVAAEVVPLDDTWPEVESYANARKEFEDALNDRLARQQREQGLKTSLSRGGDHYVGSEACARCHVEEHHAWNGTRHAHAFAVLKRKQKDSMPDCVPCHVTGYQKPGGYVDAENTGLLVDGSRRNLQNVQCEACHGMATLHDTGDPGYRAQARAACKNCHTPEQSPNFNFEEAWAKIAH